MSHFQYTAKNEDGKTVKGMVEATDLKSALKILRQKLYLVIKLKAKKESPAFLTRIKVFNRVSLNEKVNFTRQFSTMITAGLRMPDALKILELQASSAFRPVLKDVLAAIEGGGDLASAMAKFPKVFDQIYVALIRAGESAGVLDRVLARLADNMEKKNAFSRQIKGAMIYPAIIVCGMIGVGAIMILFVIPKMMVIYQDFQADLPLPTKILLGVSNLATKFWWVFLILIAGVIFLIPILMKNTEFKKGFDKLFFRLPIIGKLRQKQILTEFARTLGLLAGTGILIVEALKIVRDSFSNPVYYEAIDQVTREVEKGLPLASSLAGTEVFPPILSQMISVGEETGKLDEVLAKVSSYFELETEQAVKNLTTAIEPLIMIILGIGVAFLVISVIMPIYNLTSQF